MWRVKGNLSGYYCNTMITKPVICKGSRDRRKESKFANQVIRDRNKDGSFRRHKCVSNIVIYT